MSKPLPNDKFNKMIEHQIQPVNKLTQLHKLLQRDFEACRKSRRDLFSIEKLRTNPEEQDWGFTLQWFEMDESILREFIDYISNWRISSWQKVSKDFLREFKDKLIMEDFEE